MNAFLSILSAFTWEPWTVICKVMRQGCPPKTGHIDNDILWVSLLIVTAQVMLIVALVGVWAVCSVFHL